MIVFTEAVGKMNASEILSRDSVSVSEKSYLRTNKKNICMCNQYFATTIDCKNVCQP